MNKEFSKPIEYAVKSAFKNKGIFSKAFSFVDNHYATVGLLPGNAYTYNFNESFVGDLRETINKTESVGKFILKARADQRLTQVVNS